MGNQSLEALPYMLYADAEGQVYEHPRYRVAGFSGCRPQSLSEGDLIALPDFSKLFFFPRCPPIGLDPVTGEYKVVAEAEMNGEVQRCFAVSAFLEPGFVRSHLPAVDYRPKSYTLPMWAYCAVGFKDDAYWACGFRIEDNPKWDPRNYDDLDLVPAVEQYRKRHGTGPLLEHLVNCATRNHCFAAKNLFLKRWEGPLPVSQTCNAACLGCLSLQPESSCEASHPRMDFRPPREEIVSLAVRHLSEAPEPIVSFGQGCEGEPLTEYRLIARSIQEIRRRTEKGTINLNTNGSSPERIRLLIESGLDSIRISLNSARPRLYEAYYRPKNYHFEDVVRSIAMCTETGIYTMLNYLVFPGITDQEEEAEALIGLVQRTGVNFLHLKNLCIDPQLYLDKMEACQETGKGDSPVLGMKGLVDTLEETFPELELGYFNQPVR